MTSSSSSDQSYAATINSLAVEPPSSPRPPPLRSAASPPCRTSSRHVNFSELPPKHRSRARHRFDGGGVPGESCGPAFLAFCAWSCLAAFAFVLFVLLLGVLFAAVLHAGLPEITIRGVELRRDSTTAEAEAEVVVEFRNKNERTSLWIGAMEVEAWSGRVGLGRATIGGFSQRPRDATRVTAAVGVSRAAVDLDAEELEAAAANPIVVMLKGHVGFRYRGIEVMGVPVLVSCTALKSQVDRGNKALCSIRIIPV